MLNKRKNSNALVLLPSNKRNNECFKILTNLKNEIEKSYVKTFMQTDNF